MPELTHRHVAAPDLADAGASPVGCGDTPLSPPSPLLSVILVGQRSVARQRHGRYVAGSGAHPARMAPDLAAALIGDYTKPGDLVFDPLAGTGTTLVEAIHAGRNALGVEYEPGWVALARANIDLARRQGGTGHGRILRGDATALPRGVPGELHGQISAVLAGCIPLLKPGGVIAVVARPWRRDHFLVDLPGQIIQAGLSAGLELIACRRAVHAAVRDGQLVARHSFWQLSVARASRRKGIPVSLIQ